MNKTAVAIDWPSTPTEPLNAYAVMADEYDRPEHRTTRILERLSGRGLVRATAKFGKVRHVLEIGAGTGALTRVVRGCWPTASVLATDASAEMLAVLDRRLADDDLVSLAVADAFELSRVSNRAPDLVAAGLADPFLDRATLEVIHAVVPPGARLFVSVPTRSWAARERVGRLRIPIYETRFRLYDGSEVFTDSLTYDEDELCTLLASKRFSVVASGAERSDVIWSQPEVSWALVTPL